MIDDLHIEFGRYTSLAFFLTSKLDAGTVLDIEATHAHIRDGSLFGWLLVELDGRRWMPTDEPVMLKLFGHLSQLGADHHSFGIERNGLALLVAYCLEGVQETVTALLNEAGID